MILRRLSIALLLAAALPPAQLSAQESLIGPTGLGRLARPVDSRARAMGGAAVALHGRNLSILNPAALTQLTAPGMWGEWLPEDRTVRVGDRSSDVQTVDFPLFRVSTPLPGPWVAAVSLGSFLDQDWAVQFIDTLQLSTGDVAFEETRQSDGGVSQFRFELAGELVRGLSLGAAGIIYRGETRRQVDRAFEEGSDLAPYRSIAFIRYDGWGIGFGLQYQPFPEMIIAASGGWAADLEVREDTTGDRLKLNLPLSLELGGSWQLTPGFLLAISGGWADWSATQLQLSRLETSDAWYVGGGAELRALSGERSALLVRLGAHWAQQPFELQGGPPKERALSVGFGLSLQNGRALLDGSLEIGKRGSLDTHNVEESFRRVSLTLAVFGG